MESTSRPEPSRRIFPYRMSQLLQPFVHSIDTWAPHNTPRRIPASVSIMTRVYPPPAAVDSANAVEKSYGALRQVNKGQVVFGASSYLVISLHHCVRLEYGVPNAIGNWSFG